VRRRETQLRPDIGAARHLDDEILDRRARRRRQGIDEQAVGGGVERCAELLGRRTRTVQFFDQLDVLKQLRITQADRTGDDGQEQTLRFAPHDPHRVKRHADEGEARQELAAGAQRCPRGYA